MENEGVREEEDGGECISVSHKHKLVHPLTHGRFRCYGQGYGAPFHKEHHKKRHCHPHLSLSQLHSLLDLQLNLNLFLQMQI